MILASFLSCCDRLLWQLSMLENKLESLRIGVPLQIRSNPPICSSCPVMLD